MNNGPQGRKTGDNNVPEVHLSRPPGELARSATKIADLLRNLTRLRA